MRSRFAIGFLCITVWFGATNPVAADSTDEGGEDTLEWSPRFTRFTPAQYGLTLAAASGMLATSTMNSPSESHWQSQILLDGPARNFLAASTEPGRARASTISDYLALGLALYPFAIDAWLVAGGVHRNADVSFQLTMIGMQSMFVTSLVTNVTKQLVGRTRPDIRSCKQGTEMGCTTQTESFLSGHSSTAFASAGLICATHQNFKLYGNGPGGAIACGLSLGAATAVGTLRIVADRHYMSDVLAGAVLGLATGYLLPNLINYDFGNSRSSSRAFVPMASPTSIGLSYMGLF